MQKTTDEVVLVAYLGFFVYRLQQMITKVCTKCGTQKTIDCFGKQKYGRHGTKSECKVCASNRTKAYQAQNREYVRRYQRQYSSRNKESIADNKKQWQQLNTYKVNYSSAKRRAAKRKATPSWANIQHMESLYLIASLNREEGYDIHVDHIVPLQSDMVCGLHCEANLQLLYAKDNIGKSNRHWPDMW